MVIVVVTGWSLGGHWVVIERPLAQEEGLGSIQVRAVRPRKMRAREHLLTINI